MEAEEREASEERETFSSRHQSTRGRDGGTRDGETVRERAGELEMERAHV